MSIVNSSSVQSAVSATQSAGSGAVQVAVLKKALDAQSTAALSLIQALPPAPQLATSGNLGRNVNQFA